MNSQKYITCAALVVAAALPFGCSGGGDNSGTQTTSSQSGAPTTGAPSVLAGRGPGGPGGPPMGPGGMMPGMPGGPGQATPAGGVPTPTTPGTPTQVVKAGPPPGGVNRDPFYVRWKPKPEPPYIFSELQPQRIASENIEAPPPPNTVVTQVADRRVSGIMTGDGVYAILESNTGEPEIVKPGSETRDGYRVLSITADSVKIQRKEGNLLLTQVVPLTDAPVANAQTAGFSGGMGVGGPGGGFPGGGRFPGAGGGFPGGGRFGGNNGGGKEGD